MRWYGKYTCTKNGSIWGEASKSKRNGALWTTRHNNDNTNSSGMHYDLQENNNYSNSNMAEYYSNAGAKKQEDGMDILDEDTKKNNHVHSAVTISCT